MLHVHQKFVQVGLNCIFDFFYAVNNLNDASPLDTDVIDEIRRLDEANAHLLFLKAADDVTTNALSQAKQALFTG